MTTSSAIWQSLEQLTMRRSCATLLPHPYRLILINHHQQQEGDRHPRRDRIHTPAAAAAEAAAAAMAGCTVPLRPSRRSVSAQVDHRLRLSRLDQCTRADRDRAVGQDKSDTVRMGSTLKLRLPPLPGADTRRMDTIMLPVLIPNPSLLEICNTTTATMAAPILSQTNMRSTTTNNKGILHHQLQVRRIPISTRLRLKTRRQACLASRRHIIRPALQLHSSVPQWVLDMGETCLGSLPGREIGE